MYEMKEEYYTGIVEIDKEHEHLFELAEETYQLLKAEFIPDKYDNIKDVLRELKEYTKTHFAHEEAYMQSINYKRLTPQKFQHKTFVEKLEELDIDEMIEENPEKMIEEILNFLTDWLVHHILENDKLIGE